jgi:hypothetical protein
VSPWDFGELNPTFIDRTLKGSPERSNAQGLVDVSASILTPISV